MSRIRSRSAGGSCRRAQPRIAASDAPKLAAAPAPAMMTARELNPSTNSCDSSLQTAATSGGGIRDDQTVERPHSCLAARTLPPTARANCLSIARRPRAPFLRMQKVGQAALGRRRLTLAMAIHAAKGSMASGKEAGQVPHMFKCIEASLDAIARALSRIHTHWCCRTPCHISQSCETVATAARVSKASRRCHLRPLRP